MESKSRITAMARQLGELIEIPHRPTTLVAGVFDGNEGGSGVVAVEGVHSLNHMGEIEASSVTLNKFDRGARIPSNPTALVVVNVGKVIANHFVSRLGMDLDGNLVCHRPGGTKQCRFMT